MLRPTHAGFEPRTRDPERRDFFDLRRRLAGIDFTAFNFKGTINHAGPPTTGDDPLPNSNGDMWVDNAGHAWVWNGTTWVDIGLMRGPQGETGPQGPQGVPGTGGTGGAMAYTHDQTTPASVWTINHNLGFYPNVTVIDSGGTVVEGGIAYPTVNQAQLTFSAAFAGKAYLS